MSRSSNVTRRTAIRVAIAGAAAVAAGAAGAPLQGAADMERVQGIGGFFFRGKDPRTLAGWHEVYPNGRFARLSDPEGNPIQLWQPGGTDPG